MEETMVSEAIGLLTHRCDRLEKLVCMLARGLLQHEYAKDLGRGGTEAACIALANDDDIVKAMKVLEESGV